VGRVFFASFAIHFAFFAVKIFGFIYEIQNLDRKERKEKTN